MCQCVIIGFWLIFFVYFLFSFDWLKFKIQFYTQTKIAFVCVEYSNLEWKNCMYTWTWILFRYIFKHLRLRIGRYVTRFFYIWTCASRNRVWPSCWKIIIPVFKRIINIYTYILCIHMCTKIVASKFMPSITYNSCDMWGNEKKKIKVPLNFRIHLYINISNNFLYSYASLWINLRVIWTK